MKNAIILIMIFIILTGCKDKNSIRQDELILRFPIVVSLSDKNDNWRIAKQHGPFFDIYISNINKIKLDSVSVEGNFELLLAYSSEMKSEKIDDRYYFYQILIFDKNKLDVSIRDEILRQRKTMYKCDCYSHVEEWIDVEAGMMMIFGNNNNHNTFIDLQKFYSDPENRFHTNN